MIGVQWTKINLTGGQRGGGSYKCQIHRKILKMRENKRMGWYYVWDVKSKKYWTNTEIFT